MITGISTEYLAYDGCGQPTSINVQLTFINIAPEERELMNKLQMQVLQRAEPKMGEE